MLAFRSRKTFLAILAIAAIVFVLTRSLWLGAMGAFLIRAETPSHADYAVVLAGDSYGNRILHGAELVRRGLVRKAVIDGPMSCYGMMESDLAVNFAVRKGYPAEYFLKLPMEAASTRQESELVVAELRRLGARSFLLVTSDYHTRRAGAIFGRVAGDLKMSVVAAPDRHFRWNSWWRTREGQKIVYMEWSKTVANWFGI